MHTNKSMNSQKREGERRRWRSCRRRTSKEGEKETEKRRKEEERRRLAVKDEEGCGCC
jgi:hypothetical protein